MTVGRRGVACLVSQVASIPFVVVESVFLLLLLPQVPVLFLLQPFLGGIGRDGLLGALLLLSPLIVYGLSAMAWMTTQGARPGHAGIPRWIRIGLACRGIACVLLILAWGGELLHQGARTPLGSHLIGTWALLALCLLGMQLRLVGRCAAPRAPSQQVVAMRSDEG